MALAIGILGWTLTIIRNRRTGKRKLGILFITGMAIGVFASIGQEAPLISYLFTTLFMGFVNVMLFIIVTFLIALATKT
jgi:hypothetical protein